MRAAIITAAPLSTPHGALGTALGIGFFILLIALLSTPHGALGTLADVVEYLEPYVLSTPHGALGTWVF